MSTVNHLNGIVKGIKLKYRNMPGLYHIKQIKAKLTLAILQ
jgi:hypothetical protein